MPEDTRSYAAGLLQQCNGLRPQPLREIAEILRLKAEYFDGFAYFPQFFNPGWNTHI